MELVLEEGGLLAMWWDVLGASGIRGGPTQIG